MLALEIKNKESRVRTKKAQASRAIETNIYLDCDPDRITLLKRVARAREIVYFRSRHKVIIWNHSGIWNHSAHSLVRLLIRK